MRIYRFLGFSFLVMVLFILVTGCWNHRTQIVQPRFRDRVNTPAELSSEDVFPPLPDYYEAIPSSGEE